ncbi:hypothetical protein C8J57DRAFT_1545725 [Mycena rebaudengoi]|nr:hypothetical protein C8J57DRAFT_1545725 [Mycena rebaudengoi]
MDSLLGGYLATEDYLQLEHIPPNALPKDASPPSQVLLLRETAFGLPCVWKPGCSFSNGVLSVSSKPVELNAFDAFSSQICFPLPRSFTISSPHINSPHIVRGGQFGYHYSGPKGDIAYSSQEISYQPCTSPILSDSVTSLAEQQMRSMEELGSPLSEMEELRQHFFKDKEDLEDETQSTYQNVLLMTLKTSLSMQDVVDRGDIPGYGGYRMESNMLNDVSQLVFKFQEFLEVAANLVPGCQKFFHLDLGMALIPILENISNLPQMEMAWELLRARLELGLRFFDKYGAEYRKEPKVLSPASMESELTESLLLMENNDLKVRHMKVYYPHHNQELGSLSQRLHVLTDDWEVHNNSRTQEVADKPAERQELSLSYNSIDYSNVTVRETDQHQLSMDNSAMFGSLDPAMSYSLLTAKVHPSLLKPPRVLREEVESAPLLGSGTPFKSSGVFLKRMEVDSSICVEDIGPAQYELNILDKIGAELLLHRTLNRRAKFPLLQTLATPLPPLGEMEAGIQGGQGAVALMDPLEEILEVVVLCSEDPCRGGQQEILDQWGHPALQECQDLQVPQGWGAEEGVITQIRTLLLLLMISNLPEWDGNHDTTVQYFWDVLQKATLGGHIPVALGYWLGSRLVEGSPYSCGTPR